MKESPTHPQLVDVSFQYVQNTRKPLENHLKTHHFPLFKLFKLKHAKRSIDVLKTKCLLSVYSIYICITEMEILQVDCYPLLPIKQVNLVKINMHKIHLHQSCYICINILLFFSNASHLGWKKHRALLIMQNGIKMTVKYISKNISIFQKSSWECMSSTHSFFDSFKPRYNFHQVVQQYNSDHKCIFSSHDSIWLFYCQ